MAARKEVLSFFDFADLTSSKYEVFFGSGPPGTALLVSALQQDLSKKSAALSALVEVAARESAQSRDLKRRPTGRRRHKRSSSTSTASSPNSIHEDQNCNGFASPPQSDNEDARGHVGAVKYPRKRGKRFTHAKGKSSKKKNKGPSQDTHAQNRPPDFDEQCSEEKIKLLSMKEHPTAFLPPSQQDLYEVRIENMLRRDLEARAAFNKKTLQKLGDIEKHIENQVRQHKHFTDAFRSHVAFMRERLERLDRERGEQDDLSG